VSIFQDLKLSTAGRVEYPPLIPFQCALVIDKPLLWNNNATLWLDRVYVAISRTKVMSEFSILEYGTYANPLGEPGRSVYITSSTFVGEGRGCARVISSFVSSASFFMEGAGAVSSQEHSPRVYEGFPKSCCIFEHAFMPASDSLRCS
jgi:hypothetical protein